ncbi:hypothetical protein JXA85_07240 [Candidatus Woesearchaeota archaeon]|nr:hypothetical protein [Candidatus Woesearchaeota archaeon]
MKRSQIPKEMNKIVYWMSLLVLTISNFFIAVVLIPFLLALSPLQLYLIVMLLGGIMGMIFNHLIKDIEHIEIRHHLFAAFFIPLIGVIDLFIVVNLANRIAKVLLITVQTDALSVSLVFVASFLFPYVVTAGKK